MTIHEAINICNEYYDTPQPDEDLFFMVTEALDFLIKETSDPRYMLNLGGIYYGKKDFDQALKYYDMAAEYGNVEALTCLGYIWYYGRTGTKDYEKAFENYSKAAEFGDPVAKYKLADMYKNGYHVEKDKAKYKAIVEELYDEYDRRRRGPLVEIYTRLAGIRAEEGDPEEALRLYDKARNLLARRIQDHPFFGDLNVMKWTTEDVYELREFDFERFGLFDLYYLMKEPVKVRFTFEGEEYFVSSHKEEDDMTIKFGDKWYRTIDDFFKKASIDDMLLTAIYDELFDFEVIDNG